MRTRPFVIFWGATVAATLFLGAIWSTTGSSSAHPLIDGFVLAFASVGIAVSLFVAGRIVVVMGRVQRRQRATRRP